MREIRRDDVAAIAGLAGAGLRVGGLPAFNVDYEDAIRHSMGLIVLIVIGATLLVLSYAFRSVLIPIKAVALNLTSVAAAFGAVTIVFQDGVGSKLLGLPRPMDGGFPLLPVLVFCIVFGLSMDYEVFIVARIADGRRAGLSDQFALIEGITRTGRVITYAAAIMVLIFAAFILGEFVLIKFLGFALGVAVLLDATLIRLAVGSCIDAVGRPLELGGRETEWPADRGTSRKCHSSTGQRALHRLAVRRLRRLASIGPEDLTVPRIPIQVDARTIPVIIQMTALDEMTRVIWIEQAKALTRGVSLTRVNQSLGTRRAQ